MASGDTLLIFKPYGNEPPSASYAVLDVRNQRPLIMFSEAGSNKALWGSVLPRNYAGGGLTVYHHITFATATAGSAIIQGEFERVGEVLDIDDDGFASASVATFDVPATSGSPTIVSIAFADGAAIDSVAVGEYFRYRLTRQGESTVDNAAGSMQLLQIEIKET